MLVLVSSTTSSQRTTIWSSSSLLVWLAAWWKRGDDIGSIGVQAFDFGIVRSTMIERSSSRSRVSFSSSRSLNPAPAAESLQHQLLAQAASVREKLGGHDSPPSYWNSRSRMESALFFQSSYQVRNNKKFGTTGTSNNNYNYERGFSNWILPGKVMVGQYPGQTPEEDGPSESEVKKHMETILLGSSSMNQEAPIRLLFCCLQSELPAQDDYETWDRTSGMVFLEPESVRRRFPRPFVHYAPLVKETLLAAAAQETGNDDHHQAVTFLHSPIDDLNIPESQEPFQILLLELLTFINDHDNAAIYLHCWGGRGRGGLVGACLLSLIYPTLDSSIILDWIQTGYASRLGHERMPTGLSQSPQTDAQRAFVKNFIQEYQLIYTKTNQ